MKEKIACVERTSQRRLERTTDNRVVRFRAADLQKMHLSSLDTARSNYALLVQGHSVASGPKTPRQD
jgi:hypothetical protein